MNSANTVHARMDTSSLRSSRGRDYPIGRSGESGLCARRSNHFGIWVAARIVRSNGRSPPTPSEPTVVADQVDARRRDQGADPCEELLGREHHLAPPVGKRPL